MKVISFRINNVAGRVHVPVREMAIPKLISDGIIKSEDDLIEMDWNNTGRYVVVFTKKHHVVCPFCQTANSLSVDDLGFEEFECDHCECTFTIPETLAEIKAFNEESLKIEAPTPSHYRVMFRGEDGVESCLKNGVPAEYASLVCDGFQSHYSEGQTCWLEPEETIADLRRMCDDDRGDRYEY